MSIVRTVNTMTQRFNKLTQMLLTLIRLKQLLTLFQNTSRLLQAMKVKQKIYDFNITKSKAVLRDYRYGRPLRNELIREISLEKICNRLPTFAIKHLMSVN